MFTSNALLRECILIRSLSLLSSLRRLRSRAEMPHRRRRPGPVGPLLLAADDDDPAAARRGRLTRRTTCSSLPLPLS